MDKGGPHRARAGTLGRAMTIHLTRVDEFALPTLDRPQALNALSFALLRELAAAFDEIAVGGARALLITGAGDRACCAGADIGELMGRTFEAARDGAALWLDTLRIPSLALVNV